VVETEPKALRNNESAVKVTKLLESGELGMVDVAERGAVFCCSGNPVNDGPAAGIAPRAAIAHSILPAGGGATQGAVTVVSVAQRRVDPRAHATDGTVCVLLRNRPPTPWLRCDAAYRHADSTADYRLHVRTR
jgi:hypothetical protein